MFKNKAERKKEMGTYKIFVDTGSDIPEKVAEENNIGIIRFLSVFEDKSYVTGTELTTKEFYKKLLESDKIPTTSQTPYADLYDTLKEASDRFDTVIYFTLSSNASGQHNSALMVRNEILEENPKADIRIVDTMSFSAYETMAALKAKELLDNGAGVDEAIEKSLEYIGKWKAYILVDTLEYLQKGGRLSKASAVIGSLLDIKPVLTVKDGLIEPVEKIRGRKKLYKKLIELVREYPGFDENNAKFIVVQSNEEYGEETRSLLCEEFDIDDIDGYYELGPVIGTHIGPGTLAILFWVED